LKERYKLMTRDLGWETTYQPKDKVFPYVAYEGLKIHDWDKWEDPFRLTMDSYWKYQAEKERKFYAIIDAHAQNNGHLHLTDARYLSALKIFLQAISPGEYAAHKGFARAGREFPGVGTQIACQMQSIDEIRHAQTQIHALSNYNKFYNGFHAFADQRDRIWYTSVARSFFDDAMSAGPFEFMIAIGFSFEYVLTNLLFVPFMSGAAYNGDMATVTFGFSAQSDEARHMTLGLECIKFMLEQDPANVSIVQGWIDKWFWRGFRVLGLVSTMMDYMLPKRVMSWREAWNIYGIENGTALFKDLARYGIAPPKGWDDAEKGIDHMSHQFALALYQWSFGTSFHSPIPSDDDMAWLSAKYPDTFDKYYRPRWEHIKKLKAAGTPLRQLRPCQAVPDLPAALRVHRAGRSDIPGPARNRIQGREVSLLLRWLPAHLRERTGESTSRPGCPCRSCSRTRFRRRSGRVDAVGQPASTARTTAITTGPKTRRISTPGAPWRPAISDRLATPKRRIKWP
jgi:phenol hydroxylase P3 protein